MWNDDEIEREAKQSRALLELWEMLNDPDSGAQNRDESLIAGGRGEKVAEDSEKLIMRRRKGGTSISDIDGSRD